MTKTKHSLSFLIIILLFAISSQSQAQVKYGFKIGLNMSDVSRNYPNSRFRADTKMRASYHIGVTIDRRINNVLRLQSGILITSKGNAYKLNSIGNNDEPLELKGYNRQIYNYFETPLSLAYTINDFQVSAGAYFAFGIGGKNKWKYKGENGISKGKVYQKSVFKSSGEDGYNTMDCGLNLGIGYQLGRILFNTGYSIGLSNVPFYRRREDKISNRVISLSATYILNEPEE